MTAVKIVYLDIDGVLKPANRHDGSSALSPDNVARLNSLADIPGVRIVVSSTWRRDSNCRAKLIAQGVALPFLDASWKTPDDDDDDRCDQVARHLSQGWRSSHQVDAIAIVDDMFGPRPNWIDRHLVTTDPDAGIDDAAVAAIRAVLARAPTAFA